jgi:hypothetical protein
MKHNIPGLYYFFIGEEVGCIGSGLAANYGDFKDYDRIISFDRRYRFCNHQSYARCCSDAFGDALCDELNKSGMSYIKMMVVFTPTLLSLLITRVYKYICRLL